MIGEIRFNYKMGIETIQNILATEIGVMCSLIFLAKKGTLQRVSDMILGRNPYSLKN